MSDTGRNVLQFPLLVPGASEDMLVPVWSVSGAAMKKVESAAFRSYVVSGIPQASESVSGIVTLATAAEVTAGNSTTDVVTPHKLKNNPVTVGGVLLAGGQVRPDVRTELAPTSGTVNFTTPGAVISISDYDDGQGSIRDLEPYTTSGRYVEIPLTCPYLVPLANIKCSVEIYDFSAYPVPYSVHINNVGDGSGAMYVYNMGRAADAGQSVFPRVSIEIN